MKQLSQKQLYSMLTYTPEEGVFRWIRGPGFRRDLDGARTGYSEPGKRGQIMIGGVNYRPHQLAVLYMTGILPNWEIDHKDGDPSNNKWDNLRDGRDCINQQNQRKAHKDNKTGLLGVFPKRRKFSASIYVYGRRIKLGMYGTAQEAHDAYIKAKREFHVGCTI